MPPRQPEQKPQTQLQLISTNINALEPRFNDIVATYDAAINFKKEAHFALQILQKNEYTMGIAIRNPQSLQNAVLNIASIGLSLNPAERQAYLVPRDGAICLDVSYIGFADLATESGSLKFVKAAVVMDTDVFELNGLGREPTHSFKPFAKDRGVIVGVYCVGVTPDNHYLTEWMTIEECYKIRDRTPAWKKNPGSGPWATDEGEMLKKTVIKRAAKLWPKAPTSKRLHEAIRVVNEHEGIDFEAEREEAKEAKRLQIAEAHASQKERTAEKEVQIARITELCKIITKGLSNEAKGTFMLETLEVSKFNELHQKTNEALQVLIEKLDAMATGGNETNGAAE